jgi:hypothetical protein
VLFCEACEFVFTALCIHYCFGVTTCEIGDGLTRLCNDLLVLFLSFLPSFLLSFFALPLLPINCRCRRLLLQLILLSDTLDRTPLDEGSAIRRVLYLQNTQHSQETDIHAPAGFEPAIPASEEPQTQALDRAATGIGLCLDYRHIILQSQATVSQLN